MGFATLPASDLPLPQGRSALQSPMKLAEYFSVGTNEVAKAKGGQYWEGDLGDGRDFLYDDYDTSDKMRLNLLSDVIDRLRKLGRLSADCPTNSELLDPASESYKTLRDAQLFDTIDFIRAVHAEASAIFSAGYSARSATMYVTTFPCHECARHIVIAGIKRVVYVEPYPKSLVSELFVIPSQLMPMNKMISASNLCHLLALHHLYTVSFSSRRLLEYESKWMGRLENGQLRPHFHISLSQYSAEAARVAETATIQTFHAGRTCEGRNRK